MAQKTKELSQVKARQTKLGKKSNEELIQIVLKKDKIERSLNNQIKNLKGEVNHLSQSLESYKDQVKTLQKRNDALEIESKDNYSLYIEENKKVITLTNKIGMWRIATYAMMAVAVITIIVAVL